MTPLDARPLDLTGPLPRGRHAVEASAGTGKTYALAALATRYLVEAGVPAGDLVVVTFTRAAAAELRDRVRARLVGALDALEAASGPTGDPTERDEIEALLCAEDVPRRAQRARTALAEFDAATITTIHGFATQVLGTLGTTAPSDPDAALVDDRGALTRQVCTDVLVTRALAGGSVPLPPLTKLATVVEAVGSNPGARVVPDDDPATVGDQAALQRRLVDAVAAEADRRRRRSGRLGFDDVLGRLRDVLLDPRRGPAARTAVRQRCAVALIDEFQDTDPVQWQIFSALFDPPGPDAALVLVGDPKQAIYGFRGADVQTYLDATATPGTVQATLATNWRSDGAVLESLEALLDGATFGDPRIGFRSVAPAEHHADRRLCDAEGRPLPALSLRLALHPDLPRNRNGIETPAAARAVLADLAQQIRRLLEGATIPDPLAESGRRTLRPSDVAVLVTANSQAPEVRDALAAVGVPAVVSRGDPVLVAPAAHQLRVLLEAIARPADPTRARAACLSWFLGWSADRLVGAGDDELAAVHEDLARWARILVERGVTELLRTVWSETDLAARLLATDHGDRSMTDLDHLAELLAEAAPRRTGPSGLLVAFDQLATATRDADVESPDDVAARRVESDADAVQVMTVYAAKGLEFPVVCTPMMWRAPSGSSVTVFRDPDDRRRTIDVASGVRWPDKASVDERQRLAAREVAGQGLRLLYVALTRARHANLVWWSRPGSAGKTALARVLFARDEAGRIDPEAFDAPQVPLPEDDRAADHLAGLGRRRPDLVEVAVVGAPTGPPTRWSGPGAAPTGALATARLERRLERTARRWSFTALTAGDHDPVQPDPADGSLGDTGADDEAPSPGLSPDDDPTGEAIVGPPAPPATADGATDRPTTPPLPFASLRGGTAFGTLVHRVLEVVDFTAPDLPGTVGRAVDEAMAHEGLVVDRHELVTGICTAVATPLGPIASGRALRDLAPADRLDELDFQLPLGGAGRPADDAAVGRLVLEHLPPEHPLRPWAASLAGGRFGAVLAGNLVGSIDAVLRIRDEGTADRFLVVDYKTNTLGRHDRAPDLADYHPDRLPAAMAGHHYPLQALLYSVALHRYLRWRLPAYDPAHHLGGIAYLFLRGMAGPHAPTVEGAPHGVFAWRPDASLVDALSDLLDGGEDRP